MIRLLSRLKACCPFCYAFGHAPDRRDVVRDLRGSPTFAARTALPRGNCHEYHEYTDAKLLRKRVHLPKIRDTIFVHANSSGWKGDLQPFLCLGAGAAGALCLATTVSIASPGFLGRSGRGSTAHTIKLAPAKARMPHS